MTTTETRQPVTDNKQPATDNGKTMTQTPIERMANTASVGKAYGDPIVVQGRTIIPVAMIGMGFRSGFWGNFRKVLGNSTVDKHLANGSANEGQGRGGMMRRMMVRPVGFIDVTATESRFVPIAPGRFVAIGFVLALVVGGLMAGRRRQMMQGD